jgi:5-methylcytosine-specific restriction endonuclease McrA
MKFKELLNLLESSRETNDAFRKTGEAMAKDRAKGDTADSKAKDAARKRAERAKKVPREKLPKAELVKEILVVKTKQNRVQLIFKDSYDSNAHQLLNKDKVLSMEDAKSATNDPNFEQTRASKLLFGNVKEKPKGEAPMKKPEQEKKEKESPKKEQEKEEEKTKEKGEAKQEEKKQENQEERPKAKKLSKKEMFQAMQQMSAEQLAMLPPETRDEYFKQMRNPPTSQEFDNMTFESLSVQFGLNPISSLPFNQQVLNAIVFLSKLKSGAGDQEMQTLVALAPGSLDFTKKAFLQASKILSQVGDECIQNLLSKSELGGKNMYAEGAVDMQCGDYKFKIEAGGEFSISTDKFNQGNKIFKGILATSVNASLMNSALVQNDPNLKKMTTEIEEVKKNFNNKLISKEGLDYILGNEKYVKELQKTPVYDENGNEIGTVLDKDGNLNPVASLESYQEKIRKTSKGLFKKDTVAKSSPFLKSIASNILSVYLRGDGIKEQGDQPTHVLTANGVFALTPDYIDEISKSSVINATKNDNPISNDNLASYDKAAGSLLAKYRTIVEAKQQKEPSLKELMIDRDSINPLEIVSSHLLNSFNFDFNASLIPGFTPKDLNAIEYNYVTVNGKKFKIPVVRTSKIANDLVAESYIILNNIIVESLTNNFILNKMVNIGVITEIEASLLKTPALILEQNNYNPNDVLKTILHRALNRVQKMPENLIAMVNSLEEEYKRDYKKEYRNYHGKLKQRKERAARTKARELLMKKGKVKKGDGKDVDHKKPLRSGGSNSINNLRIRKKSENRADNGHKKGEKQNKDWK